MLNNIYLNYQFQTCENIFYTIIVFNISIILENSYKNTNLEKKIGVLDVM